MTKTRQTLKHHAMHLAMCAPMLVIAAVLIATGTGAAVLIPVLGCVAMMALMMWGMGAMAGHGRARDES